MKTLLAFCLAAFAAVVFAAEKPAAAPAAASAAAPPPAESIKGEVLEVIDGKDFTYLRLKTAKGELWSSVAKAEVKVGNTVTVENAMAMKDFKSKQLDRTFPLIYLGNLAGAKAVSPHGAGNTNPHAGMATAVPDTTVVKVAKASGADARTVAEVNTNSAQLKDKGVAVRGKVVKVNEGIMGRNWLHLRDGSGSEADGSNDLLVTSNATAKAGDVVTARGVVRTDKNFGSGYSYKVLVEEAKLQK